MSYLELKVMQRNKIITVFSHLLGWLALFSLPYVLSSGENQNIYRVIAHFWIPIVFYALIFYINYFVLIDKFLFSKKTVWYILLNLLMIASFIALKEQIESTYFQDLMKKPTRVGSSGPPLKMILYIQMLANMVPLVFSIAIKTTRRWFSTEAERKEAANFKLQSELQHLRYQLQPHFFFNSLNNIYALVDLSPEQAKASIHGLSKLMRYMLYETNSDLVSLSKEIEFITKYIELMKLRVSDKTEVNYNFPSEETGIKIAPLLFISLIENAFKHGISATQASTISINMECKEGSVIFTIENGNFPKQNADQSGSGIGLHNLQNRLDLLYSDRYKLVALQKDQKFIATLELKTTES
jgi:sensor histidine kinase YesM